MIKHTMPAAHSLKDEIYALREQIACAAQEIYDAWQQDSDGYDEQYGAGGICDDVAAAIADVLSSNIEGALCTQASPEGNDHAWVWIGDGVESYEVDIPHGLYESGGGYSWQKIAGVRFMPEMIAIAPVDMELFLASFDEDDLVEIKTQLRAFSAPRLSQEMPNPGMSSLAAESGVELR